jgi:hypothetical protein
MRNWIVGGLLGAVIFAGAAGAQTGGLALGVTNLGPYPLRHDLGTCIVRLGNSGAPVAQAYVSLGRPVGVQGGAGYAGGKRFGPALAADTAIDKSWVAACLEVDESKISVLSFGVADTATYYTQTTLGFRVTIVEGTRYTAGAYYWFVGTAPINWLAGTPNANLDFIPPAPTVALTSNATDPHSGVFTVTTTFSEAVTDLELGDITVGNGTAGNLSGSGTTYTFDVTPSSDGPVTVNVAADVATDAAGNGNAAATQLSVTTDGTAPTLEITGPTDVVTEDFTVTFTFSEGVTGFTADDVTVTNGTKGAFAEPTSGSVYTLVVTPELGTTVSVSVAANTAEDAAGNGNEASNTFEVSAGSPASEFDKYREEIRQVIVDDAARSLNSTLSVNRRMTQEARDRFIEGRRQMGGEVSGLVSRNNVPFDVDGSFELSGSTLSTRGNFFGQQGSEDGTYRRLFFGDFDIQRDGDSGSTTATLTARVAWEQMYGDKTMLGYFIGGELAHSNIKGSFEGEQDRLGLAFGGYAVHQLDEQMFLDGFITLGAGRNDLEMANDVLALTSDYTTRTATVGAALSGVYEYDQYEFRPELAFSYGKTWIGDVGFTGVAYGLTDDTLSLDAGNVSITNLTLRPQVVWALDADTVADSRTQLTYAPRLICERVQSTTTTQDCGAGGEIGLTSASRDGMSNAEFRVIMDRVGDSTRSSLMLNFERRF